MIKKLRTVGSSVVRGSSILTLLIVRDSIFWRRDEIRSYFAILMLQEIHETEMDSCISQRLRDQLRILCALNSSQSRMLLHSGKFIQGCFI